MSPENNVVQQRITPENNKTPETIKMVSQVVIVGAGPAGSVAAALLAQEGHSVLLVDSQKFPRDKTCGDGVPDGAIRIIQNISGAEIDTENFYQINQILIGSPNGRELRYPIDGKNYVIPRLTLDNWLRNLAIQAGATPLTAKVKNLTFDENNQVSGVTAKSEDGTIYDIQSQVVIGADGATSIVARELGLEKHPENESAVAIRAYIDGIRIETAAEFYLLNEILPGYAWVFPLGDSRANVGIGMRTDQYKKTNKNLQDMLNNFIDILKQKGRLETDFEKSNIAQWQLPLAINLQKQQFAFKGAVLIGDAARIINPITGGGISSGVESALIAAEVISNLLSKTTAPLTLQELHEYEKKVKKQLGPTMQKATTAANLVGNYPVIANIATFVGNAPFFKDQIAKLLSNL